jgi:hypothetical protein
MEVLAAPAQSIGSKREAASSSGGWCEGRGPALSCDASLPEERQRAGPAVTLLR